jgi:hypothetical protein
MNNHKQPSTAPAPCAKPSQTMHRAVDDATAPLVPCQECGRNLPTTELTLSGHCSRCAQLTLNIEEDSQ